ncbi:MAG: response regulator [Bacteroidota bacterium]|nr:response regulator [Bacteroidota bacterium]
MKKIVVIEDDLDLLDNISYFLKGKGFDIITATDGYLGIQKVLHENPDLIVCDVMLSGLNGFNVLNTISQIPSASNIPFIFLSGKTDANDIRMGLQLGADDYITKPFDMNDLFITIEKRIEKFQNIISIAESEIDNAFNNTQNGIFIIKDLRIIRVNRKFTEITEYELEDLMNCSITEMILPESRAAIFERIEKIFLGAIKVIDTKIKIRTKSDCNKTILLYAFKRHIKKNNIIWCSVTEVKEEDKKDLININLTSRESEILMLVSKGLNNIEIGDKLFISRRTVEKHRETLLYKTNTKNTAELIMFCTKNGLI